MPAGRPRLTYDKGTLLFPGDQPPTQHFQHDPRTQQCRARALDYRAIVAQLDARDVPYDDHALDAPLVPTLRSDASLRDYQEEALEAWTRAGRRGIVVMPTGAGKTVLALKAIEEAQAATLVVVPTLDLLEQWSARLRRAFQVPIGAQGGGERTLEPITVATYDSAYLHAPRWGNRFELVVFDEVHHLPSEGYQHIAEMLVAPLRLGLTATYEREDALHERLPELVGPLVHEVRREDLAGKHLAPSTTTRIHTDLTDAEREEYERHMRVYRQLLEERREFRGFDGHKRLIMRSGSDPRARRALLAREAARDLMLNSETKLAALADLLTRHRGERILVFTEHNRLVQEISRRYLTPALTHKTPASERAEVLERFRDGRYPVLVTGKVLDEGVDVPDASIAIILSGSGSRREFVQRLGRILRPAPGKEARLYEVVSRDTAEETTSQRRRRAPGGDAPVSS